MTPKRKAKDLFNKYYLLIDIKNYENTKLCSLIAVDEIISEVYNISHQYTALYDITTSSYLYTDCKELTFWKEVKKEIEAL